jgi:hypothetical protein
MKLKFTCTITKKNVGQRNRITFITHIALTALNTVPIAKRNKTHLWHLWVLSASSAVRNKNVTLYTKL